MREITRECARLGVKRLTLYAFSADNWKRPEREVSFLMRLLRRFLVDERGEIMENNIRFTAIGRLGLLPEDVRGELDRTIEMSRANRGMVLTLALSYGGREEIVHAARRAAAGPKGPGGLDVAALEAGLWTAGLPELDLLVRTSGERRISNFLLWQAAYAELHFSDILWPDFREMELLAAIADFQGRERRFGLTGSQLAGRE